MSQSRTAADFRLLQPADHVLRVLKRTKRRIVGKPRRVTGTPGQGGLTVVWLISDGHRLTMQRRRGINDKGALCYRVTKIEKAKRGGNEA